MDRSTDLGGSSSRSNRQSMESAIPAVAAPLKKSVDTARDRQRDDSQTQKIRPHLQCRARSASRSSSSH